MQSSVDEMMPGNLNDNLAWQTDVLGEFFINTKDRSIEGHSGGDPGVASIVSFNRENATGMIVFMNGAQSLISPSPFMLVKMTNLRAPYKRLAKKAGLIN